MIYQIYYGNSRPRQVLFDIEYYLALVEDDLPTKGLWYVELHSNSFISGSIDFLWDTFANKGGVFFSLVEFKKDCHELEELRGWLWESHSNRPRPKDDAIKDEYEWGEYVREKIYSFANKYELNVNKD